MKINGQPTQSIWLRDDGWSVEIIDQTKLPHRLETVVLKSADDAVYAIQAMLVRGAPLIGVTAAFGVALGLGADPSDKNLAAVVLDLAQSRPTAINLRWALEDIGRAVAPLPPPERAAAAYDRATRMAADDVETCRMIGQHGVAVIRDIAGRKHGAPVNILTHCNAGWLACVDWGTATSPIYQAHDAGIAVHVFVDETRPRNQGAALTTFELGQHGVPHTLIVDNAGGHLMQTGEIDLVIVGTDRVTSRGDVANKIGTYLKALAAHDNALPFYVALPSSTVDWSIADGAKIPIEERDPLEVLHIVGEMEDKTLSRIAIAPQDTKARNPGFDVTPARLVTGFITERGLCAASAEGLLSLFPERAADMQQGGSR